MDNREGSSINAKPVEEGLDGAFQKRRWWMQIVPWKRGGGDGHASGRVPEAICAAM